MHVATQRFYGRALIVMQRGGELPTFFRISRSAE